MYLRNNPKSGPVNDGLSALDKPLYKRKTIDTGSLLQ